jgi:hypothetical protein
LSLVAAGVHAGTPGSPEVKDASGDGGPMNRDLVRVHIEQPDPGNFTFIFELAGALDGAASTAFAAHDRVSLFFVPTAGLPSGTVQAYVGARISKTGATAGGSGTYLAFAQQEGVFRKVTDEPALSGTFTGTTLTVKMPLTRLAGFTPGVDKFTKLYAVYTTNVAGPLSGAGDAANVVVQTWDRAPNSGYGSDYVSIGYPPVSTGPEFNMTGPANVTVPANGSVVVPLNLTNPGATNLTLNLTAINVTQGYNVTFANASVEVAANASLILNATVSTTLGQGNTTNLTIMAADPLGANLTLNMTVTVGPPQASAPQDGGIPAGATATSTSSGDPQKDAGIPNVGLLGGLAALAVGALWRRRTGRNSARL